MTSPISDPNETTPEQLAAELGVDAKSIRAWLRAVEMRPEIEKHTRWMLTQEEADFVRRQFTVSK